MKMKLNKITIKVYAWLTIAAAMYTIGVQCFIQVAHIFPSGLGAFAVFPSFIWNDLAPFVTLIYLTLNIPLIIFFWKKNNNKFMIRTLYFLVTQAALGFFFLIPQLHDLAQDLLNTKAKDANELREKLWPIIVLSIIGGIFIGASIAFSWKYGGSSGGTDIITYYFSTKKKGDVAIFVFMASLTCVTLSFILSISLVSEMRPYWVMILFSSLVYIMMNSVMINMIYPKYKKVYVTIVSNKHKEIEETLKELNFPHAWQKENFISSYSGKQKTKLTIAMFLLEVRDTVKIIKEIDPNVWMTVAPVRSVVGYLDTIGLENNI